MRALPLILLSTCLVGVACQREDAPDPHAGHAGHDHAAMEMEASAPSGHSIYHLESAWTTHRGEEVRLTALGNKARVLAMVYSSCEVACPRIVADMKAIRKTAGIPDEQIGFVLVSIDPDRDSSERLAEFAQSSDLADGAWTLLRGDPDAVQELAAVLGVRYRKTSPTDFAHSNIISLLNTQGEIVHQQTGLGSAPDDMVTAIHRLLHGS